jgi:hypothetical protein
MENEIANGMTERPNLPILIFGGILGAVAGILIVMRIDPLFSMPNEFADYPIQPSTEYMIRYHAALRFMYSLNYAIYFAILGTGIGLTTGICAGGNRRLTAMIVTGLCGGVFGALGGYASGWGVALALQNSGREIPFLGLQIEPIIQSTAMQCFVWTFIAIGVGLGFSVATSRSIGKGIQIGIIGGCLFGVGFTLIEGICFPSANSFLVVPTSVLEKLTWAAFAGLTLGATNHYISSKHDRNQILFAATLQ